MSCRRWLTLLALLLAALGGWPAFAASPAPAPPPADAAPGPAAALTPAQAQQALAVLQDDGQRNQLLQVLRTIAGAAPALAPPIPAPSQPAAAPSPPAGQTAPASAPGAPASGTTAGAHPPAAAGAPAAAATPATAAAVAPDSLGAEVLGTLSNLGAVASDQLSHTTRAVTNFPALIGWLRFNLTDPTARQPLLDATWRLLLVLGGSIAIERIVYLLLRRPARALARRAHDRLVPEGDVFRRREHAMSVIQRLPMAFGTMLLDLGALWLMGAVAFLLIGLFTHPSQARSIVVVVVTAYVECRALMAVVRLLFAPRLPDLRLVHASDHTASYVHRWARRLIVLLLFVPAVVETARMLGLYQDAVDTLMKLLGLVISINLVVIVTQSRIRVIDWLRADPGNRGWFNVLLRGVAAWWHVVANVLIVGLWVVWTFEITDGFARIIGLIVSTGVVMVAARLLTILLHSLFDRALHVSPDTGLHFPGLERRAARYRPVGRRLVTTSVAVLGALVLFQLWGIDAFAWFRPGSVGARLLSALVSIAVAATLAVAVWETMNALLDRNIERLSREQQYVRAARLRTLLPILRTSLLIAIMVILLLTTLSEIGVNTAPLLAGASIFGVALGFGSQKLVQDFITGIFLLLENAMQVGDWVTLGGLSGAVENLSIRTIRLRAGDGSVHIVPFSAVTSVTNVNRGIGNAAVSVTVAYEEDTDRVGEVLKQVGAELRADPAYKASILSDLALWGVDKVDGAGVTIAGQIECTDAGRWGVQREFNRRMKMRLQALGVALALPMQTVLLRRDPSPPPSGPTPPESGAPSPVTDTMSPPPG